MITRTIPIGNVTMVVYPTSAYLEVNFEDQTQAVAAPNYTDHDWHVCRQLGHTDMWINTVMHEIGHCLIERTFKPSLSVLHGAALKRSQLGKYIEQWKVEERKVFSLMSYAQGQGWCHWLDIFEGFNTKPHLEDIAWMLGTETAVDRLVSELLRLTKEATA